MLKDEDAKRYSIHIEAGKEIEELNDKSRFIRRLYDETTKAQAIVGTSDEEIRETQRRFEEQTKIIEELRNELVRRNREQEEMERERERV